MRRIRESWVALGGSALIVALSVTSVLGADAPFGDGTVGQQVSELARSLAPWRSEADEPEATEEEPLDGADGAEDAEGAHAVLIEGDEVADEGLEPGDEGYEWANHGECVSWHAHQDGSNFVDENGGEEWANHGEFVTHASQVICPEDADEPESAEEALDESEEDAIAEALEPGDEGYEWANHGECVSWHAHQDGSDFVDENGGEEWANHGEFVSHAAQETCVGHAADEDADTGAAAAGPGNEKANRGGNNGRGHGRGGRP